MPAQLTDAQVDAINVMSRLGFRIVHHYSDGVVNMEAATGVMVFVRQDGTVQPPRTEDTMIAHSMMKDAGLTIRF
jgi:hypothetical protein